jgi:translocation protein SEC72
MVPMWSRARRFAHVYAYATLDLLFALFWFTAWIAVASYVVSGKGKGKDKKKTGCDNFKYGTPAKCTLSQVTIFFGVIILYASLTPILQFTCFIGPPQSSLCEPY